MLRSTPAPETPEERARLHVRHRVCDQDFWRAAGADRHVELLEQAEWRYVVHDMEQLLSSVVNEIERWLAAFTRRSMAVS